ncbi:hypothetical protein K474DRAFT_1603580, partial [Panus rudis PR-1116 ss-1]
ATSVPCERIFSSSKDTDTLRRCQLSPSTMELLQILKFIVRAERDDGITFASKWRIDEEELQAITEQRDPNKDEVDSDLEMDFDVDSEVPYM